MAPWLAVVDDGWLELVDRAVAETAGVPKAARAALETADAEQARIWVELLVALYVMAIQAGASVIAVARLLGHESAATTLNHYAGLFPSDLDDVAHRLDTAARQTIEKQSQSSGATEAPTKHRPEGSEEP